MKRGFSLQFRPYERRDPVTGSVNTWIRTAHAHQTSPRLVAFKRCVRQQLEGHNYRGGNAADNSRAVRAGLAAAARSCSGGRARAAM
jgi:hypothetical protein